MPNDKSQESSGHRPAFEVGQEIRFAVVLYGGVSLAIYMNGIAQELLRLVQATAAKPDGSEPRLADGELPDSARVYRKIARLLSRQGDAPSVKAAPDSIRTRFIVDTISGTSAGGINGIFLAKALANDQSIDDLQKLWIEEGAIERLVNDHESLADTNLKSHEPQSLLNGDRMYVKLLEAFTNMDDPAKGGRAPGKPLVDNIHLYVTTTDIRGLTVQLRLQDEFVQERRYKHVFHFIDGRDANEGVRQDFSPQNNAFLAYAARCTSSFPFAFEPMRLDVARDLAPTVRGVGGASVAVKPLDYTRFFPEHVRAFPEDPVSSYLTRSFGDGGYLDNKPFGYAIDALSIRADSLPSVRQLLYVEPTPEHLAVEGPGAPVDVIENVTAALFSLPTYETIREDLQRVLARNSLIDRIGRITSDIENDVNQFDNAKPLPMDEWRSMDLNKLINRFGVAYGGYHRLKVAAATDDLAKLATLSIGLDPDSDRFTAIRHLIGEWRAMNYAPNPSIDTVKPPRLTENEFLLRFGLGYRFRRLGFVRAKIDVLSCFDAQAKALFPAGVAPSAADAAAFVAELVRLKREFAAIFDRLTKARDLLCDPARSPLRKGIEAIEITVADLDAILRPRTDDERRGSARAILRSRPADALRKAVDDADRQLHTILSESSHRAADVLGDSDGMSAGARIARQAIRRYYDEFENFDFITFPIRYSTDVGEIDTVKVLRVGPDDVTFPPRALAGAQLAHFGAFLKREWRENDILLGRLHGAERLIDALLPGDERAALRDELIAEAQEEILQSFVVPRDQAAVANEVVKSLAQKAARHSAANETGSVPNVPANVLEAAVRQSLEPKQLLQFYRDGYQFDPSLPADQSARTLGRAVRVVGQMLEGLARKYHATTAPGAWIARLGGAFWQLVEIAVPGSLRRIVVEHWAALAALCGGLLVVASLLLRTFVSGLYSGRVVAAGVLLLLLPSAFMILVWLIADSLHGKGRLRRLAGWVAGVIVLILAGFKGWELIAAGIEWLKNQ